MTRRQKVDGVEFSHTRICEILPESQDASFAWFPYSYGKPTGEHFPTKGAMVEYISMYKHSILAKNKPHLAES
jgi:hypothetical protein